MNDEAENEEDVEQRANQVPQWLALPTEIGRSFPIKKLTQEDVIQLLLQSSGFSAQGAAQVEAEGITSTDKL